MPSIAPWFIALAMATVLSASAAPSSPRDEVWAAEVAFARSMADRDLQRFGEFVSDEAIFFSGTRVLTGKAKVVEGWASMFKEPAAPFSWAPDQVEVLASGTLALSTGPVLDPTGKVIARFNSIWRLEAGQVWRVVFDKGSPASPGPK
jgi:ketosteroid isomerase-like protein